MKRIALSALQSFCAFGLVFLIQAPAFAQFNVGVIDKGFDPADAYLFDDAGGEQLPGPEEFITSPEYRAFSATDDGSGPVAPFFSLPTHNYTGWFRPRAAGRTMAERCYVDSFRPRGFGRLYAQNAYGQRMDYKPYVVRDWRSSHGPAYYQKAEDPRCPQCDKQGCCLSSLCTWFGGCSSCGSGCDSCEGDGGCDACNDGGCDTCDSGDGCGLLGRTRQGWSQRITRRRAYRDGYYLDGSNGGCAECQAAGSQGCAACQTGSCTNQ